MGILRGFGQPAVVDRMTKRIGDEILRDGAARQPWRRSSLWLILKVTLQSSLRDSNLYKPFILFFHAHLLRICVHRNFASELLYAMRVKMARRLSKLGTAVSHHICQVVYNTAKEIEALLSKRWTEFRAIGSISPTLQLEGLDFVADTHITLDKSFQNLTNMLDPPSSRFSEMPFTRLGGFRLYEVHDFTRFMDGRLAKAISEDQSIAIADFEVSVERNLESWVTTSKTNGYDSSDVIASCIQQYYASAKDLYAANPEDSSMMILTIMDLWLALDRLATGECPLLREYSPEIPSNFLHSLLLRRPSTLKRASHIEEYLHQRHQAALEVPSVFSNSVGDSSFAVKYFCSSEKLQRLYDEINTHAQQEREKKRKELASLNQESYSYSLRASMLEHEQSYLLGTAMHSMNCQKCISEHQAGNLTIKIHEWPLPRSTQHAQLVVFELFPPRAFSAWRGITYMILRDIGMPSVPDLEYPPVFFLDSFSGLQPWVQDQQDHRVTIGSTTNPFSKKVVIPAMESSVFVDNGLSFRLCDRKRTSWVMGSFSEASVLMLCIPPIPKSSPYSSLHFAVCGVQHSPNGTIASQVDCPDDINLHEFIAFSGLRSGPHLQWLNIARELASPSLSFSREEVHTLITQTAWQLGPLSNGTREWRIDLSISSFGNVLLRGLKCLLEKIRANWLEEVTVRIIGMSGSSDFDTAPVSSFPSSYLQPSFGLGSGSGGL